MKLASVFGRSPEFSTKSEYKTPGLVIGFAGNDEVSNLEGLTTLEKVARSNTF